MFSKEFPRKADSDELELLFRILPEGRPGYRKYRDLLKEYYFICIGSNEESYILSKHKDTEYAPYVTHVFAAGTFLHRNELIDIVIHEEIDDTIEIVVNRSPDVPVNFNDTIYPLWTPGMKAPGDNSDVRIVTITTSGHTLAVVPVHKKLWLFDHITGVNHFIAPGAFYSNLCLIKGIREPAIVLNPKLLFENLANYSDNELISAFHLYNKSLKRFRIEAPVVKVQEKKAGFFRAILKKDKN